MQTDKVRLKFCPNCAEVGCIDDKFLKYHIKGYKATYNSNDIIKCTDCGCELVDCGISCEDYIIITHISLDPQFLKAMIKLYNDNIIEYNFKINQFKLQLSQDQNAQRENVYKVECPYCKSTNTKKLTTTSKVVNTALWGIFGTKRHKNYHCNNCNSDF